MPEQAKQDAVTAIGEALRAGALTSLPPTRFPLADIAAAHDAVHAGAVGKVLVDTSHPEVGADPILAPDVRGVRDADDRGMDEDAKPRAPRHVATGAIAVVATVVLVNVLIRLLPHPDVGLPSVSLPDFPGWLGMLLQIKNWIVLGVIVVIVLGTVIDQVVKDGRRDPDPTDDE